MTAAGTSLGLADVRDRAIAAAASALVDAVTERASRTPAEAAKAAWYPGHPLGSVEAIEAEIRRRREEAARLGELPAAA
ncbi:hypothetical protein [Streptomyces acidiscabies]|uniref:hypothetical protein n=1 Tax=Streptomyces acidiscabies TaxID=42234 RepID=UPI00073F473A|nr:hypothetical protein [Streptomyces acidiscabies]GAQ52124.1 hypothetical protein a10_01905 [Streptomyces acidiscabies]